MSTKYRRVAVREETLAILKTLRYKADRTLANIMRVAVSRLADDYERGLVDLKSIDLPEVQDLETVKAI